MLKKYGVIPRVATPYHCQTNGQIGISNRDQTLRWCSFDTQNCIQGTYRDMSSSIVIFEKAGHLPLDIEHMT